MIIILTIIVIIIVIMISNTPAGVKKQAEGGSYPLYQLVNLNGDELMTMMVILMMMTMVMVMVMIMMINAFQPKYSALVIRDENDCIEWQQC